MRVVHMPVASGLAAHSHWVFLPGAYMTPQDFIDHGMVDALQARAPGCSVALLDANVAEVADGSALAALQAHLRAAADASAPVWLLGISLGAHLAMACLARARSGGAEAQAAARVHGAVLLAPYLGPRDVWGEVLAAGLHGWVPPADLANDIDRQIWRWLQQEAARHTLFLGYGADDRFARAHALMAQALPAHAVDVQPGGHTWPVWTQLWQRHLERTHAG